MARRARSARRRLHAAWDHAAVLEPFAIHLVIANYGTDKIPKVKRWFARHPRYHLHFTPTSASRLKSSRTILRPGYGTTNPEGLGSVRELESAIREYRTQHNENARPFTWTADADMILRNSHAFVCELLTQDIRNPRRAAIGRDPPRSIV